jgi:hypothetical protein
LVVQGDGSQGLKGNNNQIIRDDHSQVINSPLQADVIKIFNIYTDKNISQLIASLLDISSKLPTGTEGVELIKSYLSENLSNLTVNEEKCKSLQKLIKSSEGIDSLVLRFKSHALLIHYLEKKEYRKSLAEYMSHGCYEKILNFCESEEVDEFREALSQSLRYCLAWLYDSLKRGTFAPVLPEDRQTLQAYDRQLFEEGFKSLEDKMKRNPELTDKEINEMQEYMTALFKIIWVD